MTNPPAFDPSATAIFGSGVEPGPPARTELCAVDQAAVAALPAGSALLVVQRGAGSGARFLLDTERISAGRHPKSDIFLDDVTVSRKHCEFISQPQGGYLVRDTGSLNGTYVNRARIETQVLEVGDEVQIGKFRLAYYPALPVGSGGPAS